MVQPRCVKLVRVRGGQYNVRAVRNAGVWPGCRKLVRGVVRGASSSSSSTEAAAFEEGTTVETREKSSSVTKAGGRFETRMNLGDGDQGKSLLQALHEVARWFGWDWRSRKRSRVDPGFRRSGLVWIRMRG